MLLELAVTLVKCFLHGCTVLRKDPFSLRRQMNDLLEKALLTSQKHQLHLLLMTLTATVCLPVAFHSKDSLVLSIF